MAPSTDGVTKWVEFMETTNKMSKALAPFMKKDISDNSEDCAASISGLDNHVSIMERVARRDAKFANMAIKQARFAELGESIVNPKVNHCPAMW